MSGFALQTPKVAFFASFAFRSAQEFMRMVRSDGHFLRSLRDAPDNVQETDDV